MGDPPSIPYGRQDVDQNDIEAVCAALRSDWLTTGPLVDRFEAALSPWCGGHHVAVVNSGTSALHAAYFAAGLARDQEFLTSPLTFAATANAALHLGARVRFVDVEADTGLMDPALLAAAASRNTALVAPIDYCGHPADYRAISKLSDLHGFRVVADAAHSLGAKLHGVPVGSLAHATALSFHPVKPITTAEGGAVVTPDADWARRAKLFRSHGLERAPDRQRTPGDPWHYEIQLLGLNYRLPDVLCALGISQLTRFGAFLERRRATAARYLRDLADIESLQLPVVRPGAESGWHLFVVRVLDARRRRPFFDALKVAGLGVQVHYEPVHLQPLCRDMGHRPGECPIAEDFAARCVSLPLYPAMSPSDVDRVVQVVHDVARAVL